MEAGVTLPMASTSCSSRWGGGIRLWVQMGERGTAGIGCLDCSN